MLRDNRNSTFPSDYASRVGETFVRIDACLTDALHYLDPVSHRSPFPSRIADGVPVQHQMMLEGLNQIRAAMCTIAERHGIALPTPETGAVNACRLRISEAILAVSELDPRIGNLSSGPPVHGLPHELQEDASRLVGHLMALLESVQASLAGNLAGTTASPAGRASDVSQQSPNQEAPVHPLLLELERITSIHGLGELHRRTLDFSRHHASKDIVVGLFGAVSAGKSSLINSLLGSALLPVAALPTTTIPVEVRSGRAAKGTVEFVAAKPEQIEPGRIAEFVDDHYNNANARQVTRIVLDAPAELLTSGVTLIDTPGVDWDVWDATPGGPTTAPWCDLAIVLISATAPLTLREAALVRQLTNRGARVAVLITKIDLVEADDRWRIYDHVVRGLWKSTHLDVPVYLISTCEDDPPWRRAWMDGPFADTLAQCRDQRLTMRNRQLAALRSNVLDALQIRLLWRSPVTHDGEQVDEVIGALSAIRAAIQAADPSPRHSAMLLERTMAGLANEIAHNAAALWSETHDMLFDATRLVELATNARALALAGTATRTLETLHARANIALHHAADTLGAARLLPGLPPGAYVAPAFVFERPLPTTLLPRSLGWVIGRWGFYLSARNSLLHNASTEVIRQSLSSYLALLDAWMRRSLAGLTRALDEHIVRIQAARKRDDPETLRAANQLHRDIARLLSAEFS
jgi:hypothetical protein